MTYIIAEAGTGHFDPSPKRRLFKALCAVDHAMKAGADAVKFQMFVSDEPLFCPMPGDEKRFERWNMTALTLDQWREVKGYADRQKDFADRRPIDCLWSVFQPTCIEWLKELKPRYVKVASRARFSFPYWVGPEFLISCDPAAKFDPTAEANPIPLDDLKFLQCVSEYPAALEKSGFLRIEDEEGFLSNAFTGISDHSGTIWPGLDAIYHQAKFLEVHVKLPGCDMGNDEPVCLTMEQLKLLCEARDAVARMHPNRV